MRSLDEIKKYYPENLWGFSENILREYLQCQILEIIFDLKLSEKLSFLGGTAIRIIHKSERFSLDVDFDNFNLSKEEFEKIGRELKSKLILEGYNFELGLNIQMGVFHYTIKFNELLHKNSLTPHKNEKLIIKLDTQAHNFNYKPEIFLLKQFDIQTFIRVTPIDILLSQKICALLDRKRKLGRDFYDVTYLSSLAKPNYNYLKEKIGIKQSKELKEILLRECKRINFEELAKDVQPLVFNSIIRFCLYNIRGNDYIFFKQKYRYKVLWVFSF